jgi:iron(III) transport system permease protein
MSVTELTKTPPPTRPGQPVRKRRARPKISRYGLLVAVVVVIGYFVLNPLIYLFRGTFQGAHDQLTTGYMSEAFGDSGTLGMLGNTLVFGLGAAVFATVVGSVLAFLVARTNIPMKSLVTAASLVPLIIPGILHTVAWLMLLSPKIGALNPYLKWIGLGGLNVGSMPGMIFVQGLHTVPLVFLLMLPAFKAMDPTLEEAAAISGSSVWESIRRVTLPMMRPAMLAGLLIALVTSIEGFEVPLVLGSPAGISVLSTKIWFELQTFPVHYGEAGSYSMVLIVITLIGSYFYSRFSRSGRKYQTVTGKGYRPRTIQLGPLRWVGAAFVAVYFLFAVAAPTLILLYVSIQPFYRKISWSNLADSDFSNYTKLFQNPVAPRALEHSLLLSAAAATIVMLFMALASWVVVRTKIRGRWLVDGLAFTPMALPGVVLGVALIFVYLRSPVPIYGTIWILLIAYVTKYIPYGMRYSSSAMLQIGQELEEASAVSGAGLFKTLRRIDLPLLLPGLLSGWIFIVVSAMRELSTSLLVYSPGHEVLPVLIWSEYSDGQFGALAALGVVMIAILVALVFILLAIGRRTKGGFSIDAM